MTKKKTKPRKTTIEELEAILDSEEDVAVTILPNGEIKTKKRKVGKNVKPLTMRENLGGEYALVA